MAGESIYDVEYSQEQAMPSDALTENDYTQDVFYQTRPEPFDFDNRDRGESPSQGDPYYRDYDLDEQVKFREKSLQRYNKSPKTWDDQGSYLINPYNRPEKKGSAFRVVEAHLKDAATPPKDKPKTDKPEQVGARTPTLARLMRYTSSFSDRYTGSVPKPTLGKADPKNLYWEFKVQGNPRKENGQTIKEVYRIEVQLEKKEGMKDFREMPVKISCTCPFWKFWGPDYNSGKGIKFDPYRLGPSKIPSKDKNNNPINPAPNIRDRGRKNLICKHVAAVGIVFQDIAAKHNLDTYKQVDGIVNKLEEPEKSGEPEKQIEGIKAVVDNMDRSDKKEMEPLLKKYDQEKNEFRKERMRQGILSSFEDTIETQEKSWLQKMLDFLNKFFRMNKGSSVRNASVDRVLEMYLREGDR